jgi:adenylate kinase family enzyme
MKHHGTPSELVIFIGLQGSGKSSFAIFTTAKKFEPPSLDEGFDELWSVRASGDSAFELRRL